jgi:UDP-N-acetylglucosamine transferase subunit ALG13
VIFVTVGTQLPFDRLVRTVDEWAGTAGAVGVFAQTGPGAYRPRHIAYGDFLAPDECRARMLAADAIVGHAGMGTIIAALEFGKPLLVMPRRAALGEHRNEHQLATAKRLAALGRVDVAFDEASLAAKLSALDDLHVREPIGDHASPSLIRAIRTFIAA